MIRKRQIQLWLDITLFVLFVLVNIPLITGIFLHEWLSVVLVIVVLAHILLSWSWVIAVSQRLFTQLRIRVRINYFIDVLMYGLIVTVTFSGLLISDTLLPTLGLQIVPNAFWTALHTLSANLLMVTAGIHVALHWRWLTNNLKTVMNRTASASS